MTGTGAQRRTVVWGVFELVDPPDAATVETVLEVLGGIRFPWRRVLPELVREGDRRVRIVWDADLTTTRAGEYNSWSNTVTLSDRAIFRDGLGFTLAHELGHLVDDTVLDEDARRLLTALMHAGRSPRLGHFGHDHPDARHVDRWPGLAADHYPTRLDEAFADLFVRAFAPDQWEGRHPRFVHWTDDLDAFREIVLSCRPRMFADVDPRSTHAENITDVAWLLDLRKDDGRVFHPSGPVTRAQMATLLAKLLDRIQPGWRPHPDEERGR